MFFINLISFQIVKTSCLQISPLPIPLIDCNFFHARVVVDRCTTVVTRELLPNLKSLKFNNFSICNYIFIVINKL